MLELSESRLSRLKNERLLKESKSNFLFKRRKKVVLRDGFVVIIRE